MKPLSRFILFTFLFVVTESALSQTGNSIFSDSSGRKYYDFKNVRILKKAGKVILEDTSQHPAVNICPQLVIDKVCSISKTLSGAMVKSGKNYYVINRYGDTSARFEKEPIAYMTQSGSIFAYKTKKSKVACLYDMKGNELGAISKYVYAELVKNEDKDGETYIRIYDKDDRQGLVNSKGQLLMECIYDYISPIKDCACHIVYKGRKGRAYLDKLKPQPWK